MPKPASTSAPLPALYSQRNIRLFSLVFTAITGGVLTAQNLRAVGRPGEAQKALWGSVAYTVVLMGLLYFLPDDSALGAYAVGIGLAGGYGLNSYADKFIGNKRAFPARSVWRPLLVCLLIFAPLIGLLIYAIPAAQ
ncbi:hypothetical protein [Hymenobacter aerophilus]|uniref:hypothetical protein n=1 Tax=Hymenobacter aerophilus TaxID=119644 RepID=UPI00036FD6F3|nr:hypothetical protein [Hymenobacter aerophilus]